MPFEFAPAGRSASSHFDRNTGIRKISHVVLAAPSDQGSHDRRSSWESSGIRLSPESDQLPHPVNDSLQARISGGRMTEGGRSATYCRLRSCHSAGFESVGLAGVREWAMTTYSVEKLPVGAEVIF